MNKIKEVENEIRERNKDCPEIVTLYRAILDQFNPGTAAFVTIARLRMIDEFKDLSITETKGYMSRFCGGTTRLFCPGFMKYDENGNNPYPMPYGEVISALDSGEPLYDPETGEQILDVKNEVFIYYEGTDLLNELLEDNLMFFSECRVAFGEAFGRELVDQDFPVKITSQHLEGARFEDMPARLLQSICRTCGCSDWAMRPESDPDGNITVIAREVYEPLDNSDLNSLLREARNKPKGTI